MVLWRWPRSFQGSSLPESVSYMVCSIDSFSSFIGVIGVIAMGQAPDGAARLFWLSVAAASVALIIFCPLARFDSVSASSRVTDLIPSVISPWKLNLIEALSRLFAAARGL